MTAAPHVLIVEADDLVRKLVEGWLGEAGYRVDGARGEAAAGPSRPALVIADVADPRRARERIVRLRAAHAAPLLLISARFRQGLGASLPAAHELGVHRLLAKPFTRAELLAAVADAIGGAA